MNKIPICHYVAYNAPENAKKILDAWGVPFKGNNKKALAESLQTLFRQQGEGVLMDLGNMHPDKDLILKVEEIKSQSSMPQSTSEKTSGYSGGCSCANCSEKKSNACGCSGFSGGGPWNAPEGAYYIPPRNPNVDEFQVYGFNGETASKESNKNLLLFGGVAALLAYVLYKNS